MRTLTGLRLEAGILQLLTEPHVPVLQLCFASLPNRDIHRYRRLGHENLRKNFLLLHYKTFFGDYGFNEPDLFEIPERVSNEPGLATLAIQAAGFRYKTPSGGRVR